jgi:hypothetical protein
MIVLDSDLLVIDLRYPNDTRFEINRNVLESLRRGTEPLAITCQTLLEVLGVLSFNSTPTWTFSLPTKIPAWYSVSIVPALESHPTFANCFVQDLIDIISQRCSLGDSVVLEQIRLFAPEATLLLSWNARHFRSKLAISVLTPDEWWQQNQLTA